MTQGARSIPGSGAHFFQAYDSRAADPMSLVPAIRSALWEIDANQALGTPVAVEHIGRTVRPCRLVAGVIGSFAAAALLLAACGVYGVVGYRVAQRMKEIAIRVALGASRERVTTALLADTLRDVGLGLVVGLPLALAAATAIRSASCLACSRATASRRGPRAVVMTAALLAAYLPARRVPRLDPMASLRAE